MLAALHHKAVGVEHQDGGEDGHHHAAQPHHHLHVVGAGEAGQGVIKGQVGQDVEQSCHAFSPMSRDACGIVVSAHGRARSGHEQEVQRTRNQPLQNSAPGSGGSNHAGA